MKRNRKFGQKQWEIRGKRYRKFVQKYWKIKGGGGGGVMGNSGKSNNFCPKYMQPLSEFSHCFCPNFPIAFARICQCCFCPNVPLLFARFCYCLLPLLLAKFVIAFSRNSGKSNEKTRKAGEYISGKIIAFARSNEKYFGQNYCFPPPTPSSPWCPIHYTYNHFCYGDFALNTLAFQKLTNMTLKYSNFRALKSLNPESSVGSSPWTPGRGSAPAPRQGPSFQSLLFFLFE